MSNNLNSEAKTIVAKVYVENGGTDLSTPPSWITEEDAQKYIQQLQNDKGELNTIMQQDRRSRL